MSARKINRQAWADVVSDLLTEEVRGNKSALARLIGVEHKTVTRWLRCEVDVSEESVRTVARVFHRNPMDLLVAVGYYSQDEVGPAALPDADTADPVLQQILEADVPPRRKYRMIKRLEELRVRQREVEAEEVRFWIEQAKGA